MNADNNILFREDQQFREPWLWTLMLGGLALSLGVCAWLLFWPVVPVEEVSEPFPLLPRVGMAVVILGVETLMLSFFWFACLQIEVTTQGLFVRFFPLHRKTRKIDLDHVTGIEAVQYQPLMEYGGWGIRKTRRGTAYNVRGNRGVRISYDNGCHLLLGSEREEELADAIRHLLSQ